MRTILRTVAAGTTVITLLAAPQAVAAAPTTGSAADLGAASAPAHAHNDYEHEHERPLLDALEHGFTFLEADVWLVEGELRVAHDAWELAEAPTLEEAYLDPLAALVSPNGKQHYPGPDGEFQLMIDIKSEGPATWAAIEDELAEHRKFIARYHHGQAKDRAVEAVVSGNRPLAQMQAAGADHINTDDLPGLREFLTR